jgi:hypothetical protein
MNLRKGLITISARHAYVGKEHSRRTAELVVHHSMNLREVLTPFAEFLGGPLTQKKENWRTADSVVNPSRRFSKSPRRFGMKLISTEIGCLKLKESL